MLARWSGWGAVPQVFDEHLDTYAAARAELRELLTTDGFDAASRTVLNAHYTDGALVRVMWQALQRLGLDDGDVLEPGCGAGHFIGMAPPGARMVGVERDPTSAGIAALLYPYARVVAGSFADLDADEGSFDAAVGNVPFGSFRLHDPRHNPARHSIHNHFLIKALHLTRPGGLVAALTSRYTLDARNPAARREMAELADLVGAVRLPTNAHRRAAGTAVVTDLLILRRREPDQPPTDLDAWEFAVPHSIPNANDAKGADAHGTEASGIDTMMSINQYFLEHPDHVLGEFRAKFVPDRGTDLEVLGDPEAASALEAALQGIIEHAHERGHILTSPTGQRTTRSAAETDLIDPDAALYAGFLAAKPDGTFTRRVGREEQPYSPPPAQAEELRGLLGIRDLAMALVTAENHTIDDTAEVRDLRAKLNGAYDTYVATYGPPSQYTQTRTMLAGWSVFKRWCTNHNPDNVQEPLPASPDTVRAYLTHLRDAGIGADILTKHLDGIAKAHQTEHKKLVEKVLDQIARGRDATARERAAQVALDYPDQFLVTTGTADLRLDPAADRAGREVIAAAEKTTPDEVDLDELGLRTTTIKRPSQGGFRDDPFAGVVRALEVFDPASGTARKEDILTQRVINPPRPRLGADTAEEALSICLDTHSRVDLDEIARLLGTTDTATARAELGELVFDDPDTDDVLWAPLYLSGNVRRKLARARDAAEADARFAVNVTALERVVPADLGPKDVVVQLGSWVEPAYVQQFLRELAADQKVRVERPLPSLWVVSAREFTYTATDVWGTGRMDAYELVESLLLGDTIEVFDEHEYTRSGGSSGKRKVLNVEATEMARDKAASIGDKFSAWVFENPERASALMRRYNELFNSEIPTDFSSAELSTPGLAASIALREHQIAAVSRMIYQNGVGLIHDVGAGKTLEIIAGVMERRRRGLSTKTVVVVRNDSIAEQFERQWRSAYPGAQVLVATSDDFTEKKGVDKRAEFVARVTTSSWDAIIITKDSFQRVPLSADTQREFIQRELDDIRALRKQKDGLSKTAAKKTEQALAAAEERLTVRLDALTRDSAGVSFEQTGVDLVVVDEAQDFKNGLVVSRLPDLGIPGSDRAVDLDLKLLWLAERYQHSCAVLATATPFTGKFSEIYLWLRRLGHDLTPFDEWARNFIIADSYTEPTPSGQLRPKMRMRRMLNEDDLWAILRLTSDVRMADALDIPGLPQLREGGVEIITVSAPIEAKIHSLELGRRDRAIRDNPRKPEKGADNHLVINHHGMQAALDLRIRGVSTDEPQKVDVIAEDIYAEHLAGADNVYRAADGSEHPVRGGLILAFCDESIPRPGWNFYQELKDQLVARGMREESIRFIHEATTAQAKQDLFTACRAGGVSVLIGSTARMGAGLNVQDRLLGGYEIIPPRDYRADTSHQARGRVIRQGNQNEIVFWKRVVLAPSLDAKKWEIVRQKHNLFAPLLAAQKPGRHRDVDDDESIDLADVMAAATGDRRYTEKAELDAEFKKLTRLQAGHTRAQQAARLLVTDIEKSRPRWRRELEQAEQAATRHVSTRGAAFSMTVQGETLTKRIDAAHQLNALLRNEIAATPRTRDGRDITVATLGGFTITAQLRPMNQQSTIHLLFAEASAYTYVTVDHRDLPEGFGLITRLENMLDEIPKRPTLLRSQIEDAETTLVQARTQIDAPFPHAARLAEVATRRTELTAELSEEDDTTLDATVDPDSPAGKARAARLEKRAKERAELAEQVRLTIFEAGGDDPHAFADWYVAIVEGIPVGQRPPVLTAHKVWRELGRPRTMTRTADPASGDAATDPAGNVSGDRIGSPAVEVAPELAWLAEAAMVSTVASRWPILEDAVDHLRQVEPLPWYQNMGRAWKSHHQTLVEEITNVRKAHLSPSGALIAYKAKSPHTERQAWYVVHTASGAQIGDLITDKTFDTVSASRNAAAAVITLPDAMMPRYLYALEHRTDTDGQRLDWTHDFAGLRTALAEWTAPLPVDTVGRFRDADQPPESAGVRTLHALAVLDATAPDPLAAALTGELLRITRWVIPTITHSIGQRSAAPLRRALDAALSDRYPSESGKDKALLAVDEDTSRVLTTTALWGFGADPHQAIDLLTARIDTLQNQHNPEPTLPASRLQELVLHIAELHTPEPTELERLLQATPGSRLVAAPPPDSSTAQPETIWEITRPSEPIDGTHGGPPARLPVTLRLDTRDTRDTGDTGLVHGTLTVEPAAPHPVAIAYHRDQPDAPNVRVPTALHLPALAAGRWMVVDPEQTLPSAVEEIRSQSHRAAHAYLNPAIDQPADPVLTGQPGGSSAAAGPTVDATVPEPTSPPAASAPAPQSRSGSAGTPDVPAAEPATPVVSGQPSPKPLLENKWGDFDLTGQHAHQASYRNDQQSPDATTLVTGATIAAPDMTPDMVLGTGGETATGAPTLRGLRAVAAAYDLEVRVMRVVITAYVTVHEPAAPTPPVLSWPVGSTEVFDGAGRPMPTEQAGEYLARYRSVIEPDLVAAATGLDDWARRVAYLTPHLLPHPDQQSNQQTGQHSEIRRLLDEALNLARDDREQAENRLGGAENLAGPLTLTPEREDQIVREIHDHASGYSWTGDIGRYLAGPGHLDGSWWEWDWINTYVRDHPDVLVGHPDHEWVEARTEDELADQKQAGDGLLREATSAYQTGEFEQALDLLDQAELANPADAARWARARAGVHSAHAQTPTPASPTAPDRSTPNPDVDPERADQTAAPEAPDTSADRQKRTEPQQSAPAPTSPAGTDTAPVQPNIGIDPVPVVEVSRERGAEVFEAAVAEAHQALAETAAAGGHKPEAWLRFSELTRTEPATGIDYSATQPEYQTVSQWWVQQATTALGELGYRVESRHAAGRRKYREHQIEVDHAAKLVIVDAVLPAGTNAFNLVQQVAALRAEAHDTARQGQTAALDSTAQAVTDTGAPSGHSTTPASTSETPDVVSESAGGAALPQFGPVGRKQDDSGPAPATTAEPDPSTDSLTEPGVWSQRIRVDLSPTDLIVSGTDRGRDPDIIRATLKNNSFWWQKPMWRYKGRASGRDQAAQAMRDLLSELDAQARPAAAAPSHPPTPQQQEIKDAVEAGHDVAVFALAGTGKTTTLRMLAHALPDLRIVYIAFNRSIADEAQMSFPGHVDANTMHSFAKQALLDEPHGALLDKLGKGMRLPKDIAPVLGITAPYRDGVTEYSPEALARLVMSTVAQFRNSAADKIEPAHLPAGILENKTLAFVVLHHAHEAWTDILSPTGRIVFTHDDYLKIWALTKPRFNADVIFFDEAQDINDVQTQVILDHRTARDGHRAAQIIVVGDSYQSIYGFRGAKDALRAWPVDVRLPLTQSWRFGPAIADHGNRFLTLLKASMRLEGNPALDTRIEPVPEPDAVLCRTNAGAVTAVFEAHESGKRVALVGGGDAIRDIAEAALALQRGRRTRHPELSGFADWSEVREAASNEETVKHLQPFVRLVDRHGAHTLIDMANALVSETDPNPDTGPQIVVSTAHKAKGREWDAVRIAGDFRGPNMDDDGNTVLPGPEELRLSYVAVTRAKKNLELGSLNWILDYPSSQPAPVRQQAHASSRVDSADQAVNEVDPELLPAALPTPAPADQPVVEPSPVPVGDRGTGSHTDSDVQPVSERARHDDHTGRPTGLTGASAPSDGIEPDSDAAISVLGRTNGNATGRGGNDVADTVDPTDTADADDPSSVDSDGLSIDELYEAEGYPLIEGLTGVSELFRAHHWDMVEVQPVEDVGTYTEHWRRRDVSVAVSITPEDRVLTRLFIRHGPWDSDAWHEVETDSAQFVRELAEQAGLHGVARPARLPGRWRVEAVTFAADATSAHADNAEWRLVTRPAASVADGANEDVNGHVDRDVDGDVDGNDAAGWVFADGTPVPLAPPLPQVVVSTRNDVIKYVLGDRHRDKELRRTVQVVLSGRTNKGLYLGDAQRQLATDEPEICRRALTAATGRPRKKGEQFDVERAQQALERLAEGDPTLPLNSIGQYIEITEPDPEAERVPLTGPAPTRIVRGVVVEVTPHPVNRLNVVIERDVTSVTGAPRASQDVPADAVLTWLDPAQRPSAEELRAALEAMTSAIREHEQRLGLHTIAETAANEGGVQAEAMDLATPTSSQRTEEPDLSPTRTDAPENGRVLMLHFAPQHGVYLFAPDESDELGSWLRHEQADWKRNPRITGPNGEVGAWYLSETRQQSRNGQQVQDFERRLSRLLISAWQALIDRGFGVRAKLHELPDQVALDLMKPARPAQSTADNTAQAPKPTAHADSPATVDVADMRTGSHAPAPMGGFADDGADDTTDVAVAESHADRSAGEPPTVDDGRASSAESASELREQVGRHGVARPARHITLSSRQDVYKYVLGDRHRDKDLRRLVQVVVSGRVYKGLFVQDAREQLAVADPEVYRRALAASVGQPQGREQFDVARAQQTLERLAEGDPALPLNSIGQYIEFEDWFSRVRDEEGAPPRGVVVDVQAVPSAGNSCVVSVERDVPSAQGDLEGDTCVPFDAELTLLDPSHRPGSAQRQSTRDATPSPIQESQPRSLSDAATVDPDGSVASSAQPGSDDVSRTSGETAGNELDAARGMADAALAWWDAGCSVVRVETDGSKRPLPHQWAPYQRERATREHVAAWFKNGHPGVGIVTGAVSGGLEMFEFEGRAMDEFLYQKLRSQMRDLGHQDLWDRVMDGYDETSPSGGIHVLYRVEGGVDRNTRLAQRDARDDELTEDEQRELRKTGRRARRVLIETRGEGGFVVVAPSHGPVHESGGAWQTITGSPSTIPTITAAERDILHMAARDLDQIPAPPPIPEPAPRAAQDTEGLRPGDDFNQRASWPQVLQPHGWVAVGGDSTRTYWRRPGRDHGVSAVTGGDRGDYLWVFSTSTALPSEQALSKWRTYGLLDHAGDFSAAARALSNAGYGDRQSHPPAGRQRSAPGRAQTDRSRTADAQHRDRPTPEANDSPTTTAPSTTDQVRLVDVDTSSLRPRQDSRIPHVLTTVAPPDPDDVDTITSHEGIHTRSGLTSILRAYHGHQSGWLPLTSLIEDTGVGHQLPVATQSLAQVREATRRLWPVATAYGLGLDVALDLDTLTDAAGAGVIVHLPRLDTLDRDTTAVVAALKGFRAGPDPIPGTTPIADAVSHRHTSPPAPAEPLEHREPAETGHTPAPNSPATTAAHTAPAAADGRTDGATDGATNGDEDLFAVAATRAAHMLDRVDPATIQAATKLVTESRDREGALQALWAGIPILDARLTLPVIEIVRDVVYGVTWGEHLDLDRRARDAIAAGHGLPTATNLAAVAQELNRRNAGEDPLATILQHTDTTEIVTQLYAIADRMAVHGEFVVPQRPNLLTRQESLFDLPEPGTVVPGDGGTDDGVSHDGVSDDIADDTRTGESEPEVEHPAGTREPSSFGQQPPEASTTTHAHDRHRVTTAPPDTEVSTPDGPSRNTASESSAPEPPASDQRTERPDPPTLEPSAAADHESAPETTIPATAPATAPPPPLSASASAPLSPPTSTTVAEPSPTVEILRNRLSSSRVGWPSHLDAFLRATGPFIAQDLLREIARTTDHDPHTQVLVAMAWRAHRGQTTDTEIGAFADRLIEGDPSTVGHAVGRAIRDPRTRQLRTVRAVRADVEGRLFLHGTVADSTTTLTTPVDPDAWLNPIGHEILPAAEAFPLLQRWHQLCELADAYGYTVHDQPDTALVLHDEQRIVIGSDSLAELVNQLTDLTAQIAALRGPAPTSTTAASTPAIIPAADAQSASVAPAAPSAAAGQAPAPRTRRSGGASEPGPRPVARSARRDGIDRIALVPADDPSTGPLADQLAMGRHIGALRLDEPARLALSYVHQILRGPAQDAAYLAETVINVGHRGEAEQVAARLIKLADKIDAAGFTTPITGDLTIPLTVHLCAIADHVLGRLTPGNTRPAPGARVTRTTDTASTAATVDDHALPGQNNAGEPSTPTGAKPSADAAPHEPVASQPTGTGHDTHAGDPQPGTTATPRGDDVEALPDTKTSETTRKTTRETTGKETGKETGSDTNRLPATAVPARTNSAPGRMPTAPLADGIPWPTVDLDLPRPRQPADELAQESTRQPVRGQPADRTTAPGEPAPVSDTTQLDRNDTMASGVANSVPAVGSGQDSATVQWVRLVEQASRARYTVVTVYDAPSAVDEANRVIRIDGNHDPLARVVDLAHKIGLIDATADATHGPTPAATTGARPAPRPQAQQESAIQRSAANSPGRRRVAAVTAAQPSQPLPPSMPPVFDALVRELGWTPATPDNGDSQQRAVAFRPTQPQPVPPSTTPVFDRLMHELGWQHHFADTRSSNTSVERVVVNPVDRPLTPPHNASRNGQPDGNRPSATPARPRAHNETAVTAGTAAGHRSHLARGWGLETVGISNGSTRGRNGR